MKRNLNAPAHYDEGYNDAIADVAVPLRKERDFLEARMMEIAGSDKIFDWTPRSAAEKALRELEEMRK